MTITKLPGSDLLVIEQAKAMLASATTVDHAKNVRDKALAMSAWARAARAGREAEQHAAEIAVRAERRMGELLADTPMDAGGRPSKTGSKSEPVSSLSKLGVSKKESSAFQRLAAVAEEAFEAALTAAKQTGKRPTVATLLRAVAPPKPKPETPDPASTVSARDVEPPNDAPAAEPHVVTITPAHRYAGEPIFVRGDRLAVFVRQDRADALAKIAKRQGQAMQDYLDEQIDKLINDNDYIDAKHSHSVYQHRSTDHHQLQWVWTLHYCPGRGPICVRRRVVACMEESECGNYIYFEYASGTRVTYFNIRDKFYKETGWIVAGGTPHSERYEAKHIGANGLFTYTRHPAGKRIHGVAPLFFVYLSPPTPEQRAEWLKANARRQALLKRPEIHTPWVSSFRFRRTKADGSEDIDGCHEGLERVFVLKAKHQWANPFGEETYIVFNFGELCALGTARAEVWGSYEKLFTLYFVDPCTLGRDVKAKRDADVAAIAKYCRERKKQRAAQERARKEYEALPKAERERREAEAQERIRRFQEAFERAAASREAEATLAELELQLPCSASDVRRAARSKLASMHPDKGGSTEAFVAFKARVDVAVKHVESCGNGVQA